jgi:hypothetical protein
MALPPPDVRPIDRAGKVLIGPMLGAASMAEVYRDWMTGEYGFQNEVAVKRVLAAYSGNADFLAMFTTRRGSPRSCAARTSPRCSTTIGTVRAGSARCWGWSTAGPGEARLTQAASVAERPLHHRQVRRGLDRAHTTVSPTTAARSASCTGLHAVGLPRPTLIFWPQNATTCPECSYVRLEPGANEVNVTTKLT